MPKKTHFTEQMKFRKKSNTSISPGVLWKNTDWQITLEFFSVCQKYQLAKLD
jgi:hypothetical protein